MGHMREWTINTDYPWISPICIESISEYSNTLHTESEVHDIEKSKRRDV